MSVLFSFLYNLDDRLPIVPGMVWEHNKGVVYILSDVSLKILRGFGLSTSDSFTLLTMFGLIGPRREYHDPGIPTAVWNFEKKEEKLRQSTNYLMAVAHHRNQFEIDVDTSAYKQVGFPVSPERIKHGTSSR